MNEEIGRARPSPDVDYSSIRADYAELVEAAEYGILCFAVILLPAAVVWFFTILGFASHGGRRVKLWTLGYCGGVALFALLAVGRIYWVQEVKEANMLTEAEMRDWATDTHVVFAPVLQPIVGAIYCVIHLLVALAAGWTISWLSGTNRSAAEFMQ